MCYKVFLGIGFDIGVVDLFVRFFDLMVFIICIFVDFE